MSSRLLASGRFSLYVKRWTVYVWTTGPWGDVWGQAMLQCEHVCVCVLPCTNSSGRPAGNACVHLYVAFMSKCWCACQCVRLARRVWPWSDLRERRRVAKLDSITSWLLLNLGPRHGHRQTDTPLWNKLLQWPN